MPISNDSEFKTALNGLTPYRQRLAAARFTENVLSLCGDPRVRSVVSAARRSDITELELAALYKEAKAASVDSYTRCGHECDWINQAGHFVALAAVACVTPPEGGNVAWEAAMQARMARTCETVAIGQGTDLREAEAQYRILSEMPNA